MSEYIVKKPLFIFLIILILFSNLKAENRSEVRAGINFSTIRFDNADALSGINIGLYKEWQIKYGIKISREFNISLKIIK